MIDRRRVLLAAFAALCGCGGGTEPGNTNTLVVTYHGVVVSQLTFASIGEVQPLVALVLNQSGDTVASGTPIWSTSAASVVQVSPSGLATSIAGGSADITVSLSGLTTTVAASVTQVVASIGKLSGDNQTGVAGKPLAAQPTVRLLDARGTPVAARPVVFAAVGGGLVAPANGTTDPAGNATAAWTLGTNVTSAQQLTVTTPGAPGVTAIFAATVTPDIPAAVTASAGSNQTATPGFPLTIPLDARVADQYGNGIAGRMVSFTVTAGGGSVIPAAAPTNATGLARTWWTVGAAGTNTVSAATAGVAAPALFNASVTAPGAARTLSYREGTNQAGLQGSALNVDPAVLVTDSAGRPVSGISVSFGVSAGSGSVGAGSVMTDGSGIARTSWVIGAGVNALMASSAGLTGSPVQFSATGDSPLYNLQIALVGSANPAETAAPLDSARLFWQQVIYGDVPDISIPAGFVVDSLCVPTRPALSGNLDDLFIYVMRVTVDGPGGTLAASGPCYVRTAGILPVIGVIFLDNADVAPLIAAGQLTRLLIHEMGHVIGFGSIWPDLQLLTGENAPDPFFTGAQALLAFDQMGGLGYTGGGRVPVENAGGTGSRDGHWRESVFGDELMTSIVGPGLNPFSRLSAASMIDLGYKVNLAGAEAYSHTFSLRAAPAPWVGYNLGDDVRRGPIHRLDARGRVVGQLR